MPEARSGATLDRPRCVGVITVFHKLSHEMKITGLFRMRLECVGAMQNWKGRGRHANVYPFTQRLTCPARAQRESPWTQQIDVNHGRA